MSRACHQLPKLIRLKYATETNRWTSMKAPVARLLDATSGNPAQSRLWAELLRGHGVVDVASLVFRDHFGCWAFLGPWRIRPAEPFTEGEAAYLTPIVPAVTERLRRPQADTFHVARAANVPDGPAVLVLSPDPRVRAQTPETEAYLRALVPPIGNREPIPGAYNVGAQLRANEDGVDNQPRGARTGMHGDSVVRSRDRVRAIRLRVIPCFDRAIVRLVLRLAGGAG
jgi:hypothetical protein